MAHFAKIDSGSVTQVIVAEQDYIDTLDGEWIQTSYNTVGGVHQYGGTPLRRNYAGLGYIYDSVRDAFYAPQPYPSWILNEGSCIWESPQPYPSDRKLYSWNEEIKNWKAIDI